MTAGAPNKRELWEPSQHHRDTVERVAKAFDFTAFDALSRKKNARHARMRHAVIYVLHGVFPELTCREIGQVMAGRDHSTVLHSLKQASKLMREDGEFAMIVSLLLKGRTPPVSRFAASRAEQIAQRREDRMRAMPPEPPREEYRPTSDELAEINLKHDIELAGEPRFAMRSRPANLAELLGGRSNLLSADEIRRRAAQTEVTRLAREQLHLAREKPGLNGRKAKPLSEQVC